MQDGVHLQRAVEVRLAVEDGRVDVRPTAQKRAQFGRGLDCDAFVAGLVQMLLNPEELGARQRYGYGGAWHD